MTASAAGAPRGDLMVRDVLSSLTALQALSMVMNDNRTEDEILDLAVSALPSLSHGCWPEAVWLDGQRRANASGGEGAWARTGLEREIEGLSSAGGPIQLPGDRWGWAFPLSSRDGASGYLVVGSAEPPPADEWTLIQALAQLTGAALANARLLARERATRARIADEQATLRRVAALVAQAAPPEDVFAAVAAEAGRLRDADYAAMSRYNGDRTATIVGSWARIGDPLIPVGATLDFGRDGMHARLFETGQPARIDDYRHPTDVGVPFPYKWDVNSVVGVPIHIDGRQWGAIGMLSRCENPLPADTEAWLAGFTELVAAAIANAEARVELRGIAEEQAALRRVATLVAGAASPDQVFAAVAAEVGTLLDVDVAVIRRYDADGAATILAAWTGSGALPLPVGSRESTDEWGTVVRLVFDTGRPARIDDDGEAISAVAEPARPWAVRWSLGVPISVDGRLWGVVTATSKREDPPPAGTEDRLAAFTELLGTALANAEARAALTASRARIVAAGDAARHRTERDLHDGAQQRLVSLALQLRAMHAAVPPGAGDLAAQLDGVAEGLDEALEELREVARGIHPAALAKGGLTPALKTLAHRSAVPVRLDVDVDGRLPEQIEVAGYCVVAEALTNAAKHADASFIDVRVVMSDGMLHMGVRDDGRGGADATRGSGLVGLTDRVEALGGRIAVHSPPGGGTSLEVVLPLG